MSQHSSLHEPVPVDREGSPEFCNASFSLNSGMHVSRRILARRLADYHSSIAERGERQTLTTRDGSDSMLKTKVPIRYLLLTTNLRNPQPMMCSSRTKSNPRNRHSGRKDAASTYQDSSCNAANDGRDSRNETIVLVAQDSDEPRQQATVEQETMLIRELSRLKGAPSTCCLQRRTQE